MDPYTGEVYAMATYPSYDGNDYKAIAASDPSRFIDPVVASVYEPGSVFKMMTAAAALTNGTVTPLTRVKDVGTLHLDNGRTKIDDADRKGMGWMTFQDGVAYSRNVVAAKVALGLGKTTEESSTILHDMWLRLGYGRPTGIDVAGEVGGLVRDPAHQAVAPDRPRQRRIRPGRGGHPDPAGDGLRGVGQRRHDRPAACRQGRSAIATCRRSPRRPASSTRRSRGRWSR